jgi:hypothetical protein
MRESPKYEKTHLPSDSYEEWFSTQRAKPTKASHGRQVVQDSYEAWIARLVKRHRRQN